MSLLRMSSWLYGSGRGFLIVMAVVQIGKLPMPPSSLGISDWS
jgi:hypothetical protein